MKRPLFPCLIGLVLGEAAAVRFGWKGVLFPALIFLLTGISFFVRRKNRSCLCLWRLRGVLTGVFMVLGMCLFMLAYALKDPLPGTTLPASGWIYGKIAYVQVDEEGMYDITLKEGLFLTAEEYSRLNHGQQGAQDYRSEGARIRGSCRIFHLMEQSGGLWPGDWIVCRGELTALSVPTNPGEFNSEVYYQSRGISAQFFADSFQKIRPGGISLEKTACLARRAVGEVYQRVLGEDYRALLNAMVLGDKGALSEEQEARYEENGVAHLLSVSGLHVSIMAGSWFRFLRKRKMPYAPACVGGCLLLVFYGCLTGFGNSILRAVIMYAVYLGAEFFGAQYDMTSAMSLAGILMIMESPWRLLEGGCQMSFAAIFAIGYVLPWVKEMAKKREGEEDGRIRRFPRWRKRVGDALLSSVVISGVTLPVVLRVFFTFSPYSVFINMVVIPCMTPMMISGIVAGLAGVFLPPGRFGDILIRILFLPAVSVLGFFDLFLERMRELPGAVWTAGCPSLPEMGLLYLFEVLLFYIWYKRLWTWGLRVAVCTAMFFLIVPSDRQLFVTMLDVGQGDGIVLQMPEGENMLIDGGSTSRSGVGQYVIAPALRYYGIAELDYVVVTHMDEDHVSGVRELLEMEYPVRRLLLPGGQDDKEMAAFAAQAEKAGTEVIYMERGDTVYFSGRGAGDTCFLRCMHPYTGFQTGDPNAASLVFHLRYDAFDALFTGDLEKEGEEALCEYMKNESWKLELLKVAHHGSKYSTGVTFLHQMPPQAALISAGEQNRYGHPHRETLDRLYGCGADIYETSEGGAITVKTDGKRWSMYTFLQNRHSIHKRKSLW